MSKNQLLSQLYSVSNLFSPRPSPLTWEISLGYNPNKIAAGIAGGLYFVASLVLFIRLFSHRTWWGLCLPIAAGFMAIGFFMRIPMAMYPNSLPIFMIQQLYILLPPAAYLAFNYILYGRFIVQCVDRKYSWIRPEKVAKYFVASDITTFLIQGGGGGMQASTNITSDNIGARILLGGLVLQTLSFAFFMALVYHAYRSITKDGIKPSEHRWGTILRLLFFSSTFFMIRCVYRTIELGQGNGGYLITHEIYFYLLDSLPLLIGLSTYIFFWPTKYFEAKYPSTVYDNIPLRP
ncbi:RTA1 like protein-domain-containing protein [Hygrophoropsis aurantiaca]|uniref:RTA1 like protein-domain-containing protein n=1 Tax=Hygrophoropsis aurantiaca TaxID=72124 RepID=A0ACB7ZPF4_9AGAM|nr:RTA1 like protein-domain-containing protein [Hygrophoropsis aurantiaca]